MYLFEAAHTHAQTDGQPEDIMFCLWPHQWGLHIIADISPVGSTFTLIVNRTAALTLTLITLHVTNLALTVTLTHEETVILEENAVEV